MATKTSSGWRWLVGGAAFHSPYSLRLQGIVGPMMFRVAPSQLLAHIEIGSLPKAAQILRELKVSKIRLITNSPVKRVGLESYGLEIVENEPIVIEPNPYNRSYLETKRIRMGHKL